MDVKIFMCVFRYLTILSSFRKAYWRITFSAFSHSTVLKFLLKCYKIALWIKSLRVAYKIMLPLLLTEISVISLFISPNLSSLVNMFKVFKYQALYLNADVYV